MLINYKSSGTNMKTGKLICKNDIMKYIGYLLITLLVFAWGCRQPEIQQIDLSGAWRFQIDSSDRGATEKWFNQELGESVNLPGSMAENGKGHDITVKTQWTGQIVDHSWFTDDKYERYRKEGNVKIPFWLQPVKHYIGAAWYQKEVEIPASWEGQCIALHLERPHWETQVWVDDQKVGMENSLGAAHIYNLTNYLLPGKHRISIRVDNRVKEVDPGMNSHSISDHTQSNWNGIVGKIALKATALVFIDEVKLYPDVKNKTVTVKSSFRNLTGKKQEGKLELEVQLLEDQTGDLITKTVEGIAIDDEKELEIELPMGNHPLLWDEFHPNLYAMNLKLTTPAGADQRQETFGMREFETEGTRFTINGRPVFLRGTLECAIFPKTGYPATDVKEWKRILNVCKAHGLNHMRFHSWCPPEAAFDAADQLGVYLQVECSSWANSGSSVGDGKPIDEWLYKEAEQILDTYGNHPSFCMMAYGNEPAGKHQGDYLRKFVNHWRSRDSRRVYTGGAGWPYIDNLDYYNNAAPRIQGWGQGLKSIINSEPPQTLFDFSELIHKTPMPYVSHEIGQWCVYPNFKEIQKYTGVLKAKNLEIFQETLEENHMGDLADSFLLASGKLQALCYKADIEAALRTKGFAGFQLLDLHDFPGQGTALVGVMDPFWEEKGYISSEEYSRFCNQTVPLARFEKRVFYDTDTIKAAVEVAHFGEEALKNCIANWTLSDAKGATIASGDFPSKDIPLDNGIALGAVAVALKQVDKAQKLILIVDVQGYSNSWDIWVYPSEKEKLPDEGQVKVVRQLDDNTITYLKNGGKVLLTPTKGSLRSEKGGDIGIGFSSIFWNTAWTRGQKPHTLGVLCDPNHPALADFPTAYHSNWQWWDAMSHSNAIILDEFTPDLKPLVRIIDDWFTNRRLALLFETKVGKGKLMVSGIDLLTDQEKRPEAQQLLYSLKKYMTSHQFNPVVELDEKEITSLFY